MQNFKVILVKNTISYETGCFNEDEVSVISDALRKWLKFKKEFLYSDINYDTIFDFFSEAQEETGINYDWETGDNSFIDYLEPDSNYCYHLDNFYIEECK